MSEMKATTSYEQQIRARSPWRYTRGLLIRWWQNVRYGYIRWVARRNGAKIGQAVVMPFALARKANANLSVGDHTSIQTVDLDLRNPVSIGCHVILGAGTEILTTSHDIDQAEFPAKHYGIVIDDYAWLPTKVLVLPSCRHIGYGAVVSSGSVVVHDVEPMSVVGGNPAQMIRQRRAVHSDLVVESLLGGDYEAYRAARNRNIEP